MTLADRYQCHTGEIYTEALKIGVWPYRYIRNRDGYSRDDQLKLAGARAAIVGCGGLGGTVTLLLARSGVGFLTLVDYDVFDETNLNRQALSGMQNMGTSKSETGRKMTLDINPGVRVRSEQVKIDEESAPDVLSDADVIVDALDNIPDRLVLQRVARNLNIPLVHGALAGFNGQVMTILPGDPGLELIYPSDAGKKDPESPEAIMGVPAITPSVVASLQAMEVVKILLDRGQLLRNKLIYIDLESSRFNIMSFPETTG
ncbi:MAG: HesA/MoeB/ThiF family protein [Desulfobacteraceae bacterium]|nr:HesA/MoeB/ThiF family protein [Desulfobacteraceae bacterium]